MSWRSSDGVWQFYKDGSLHIHTRNLHTGHTIRAGGSLVLGQEQDSLGGSFDSNQSFQGSLTNVNVWSYVLPASTIKSMSKSCLSGEGNVYKWSDFIYGVKGKAAVVIPSPCYPLSSRRWLLRVPRHTVFSSFKKWPLQVKLIVIVKHTSQLWRFNVKFKVRETSHEHKCTRIRIKLISIANVCSSVKIYP